MLDAARPEDGPGWSRPTSEGHALHEAWLAGRVSTAELRATLPQVWRREGQPRGARLRNRYLSGEQWLELWRAAAFPRPDHPLTVYRGAEHAGALAGVTWSTSQDIALSYAWMARVLRGPAVLLRATAPREAVLADVDQLRPERRHPDKELICDPALLGDVEWRPVGPGLGSSAADWRRAMRPAESERDAAMKVPVLTDGGATLDALRETDADPIWAASWDPAIAAAFNGFGMRVDSLAGAVEAIRRSLDQWASGGHWRSLAIRRAGQRELAGYAALTLGSNGGAGIALWLVHTARHEGLAQAAVELLVRYAFEQLGRQWIEAWVRPDNHASRRLFERSGFTLWTRTRELDRVYHLSEGRWRWSRGCADA